MYRGELGIVVDVERTAFRHRVYVVMFPDFATRKFYSDQLTQITK